MEYESKYLKEDHEGIITREDWESAQRILAVKTCMDKPGVSGKANVHHPLYGKIFCSECEAPFVRKTVLKETLEDGTRIYKKVWKCAEREKGKKRNGCKNKVILEETLLKEISLQMEWEWS